ncbi:MAG: hypothetical protein AAF431_19790 [Pseudomonadota bacterium]
MAKYEIQLPRYVLLKRLSNGKEAFYFNPPSWARRKDGCPVSSEALPNDISEMQSRAATLNGRLDAFRLGTDVSTGPKEGTIDWLVEWFLRNPKVLEKAPKTIQFYEDGCKLLANHKLDGPRGEKGKGKRLGDFSIKLITAPMADAIYERIQYNDKGKRRLTTANAVIRTASRMFNLAVRRGYVDSNPFEKMELSHSKNKTVATTREQLMRFVAKADELGKPSMALAALLTYEFTIRQVDVLSRLSWSDYDGDTIRIYHHKTEKTLDMPLFDAEGPLFPELTERLNSATRRGPLIVMRDDIDGRRKEYLPYKISGFQHSFRKVADLAGLPKDFTFLGLRHGGMTEMGDAELTDQEMIAVSTRTQDTLRIYANQTTQQRQNGLRKRRNFVTSREQE